MESGWIDAPPQKKLSALIKTIDESCTVSDSAQRVMDLTRAGANCPLTEIADAVVKEPPLAAELLRLANSPFFGQVKGVYDVKRAVVVIGVQELHNISAAFSMMAAFSTTDPLSKTLRDSSVLSGAVARMLSRHLGIEDESIAFLSGLLSEIGAMACMAVDTPNYKEIWNAAEGRFDARAELESIRYSTRSEEIGYLVLREKKLPDDVASAVKQGIGEDADLLARVTCFSRQVAPIIIRAANSNDSTLIHEDIPKLYRLTKLPPISTEQLISICIEAAKLTELSLRGEASLTQTDEPEEEFSVDPAAMDIQDMVAAERANRKTLAMEAAVYARPNPVRMGKASDKYRIWRIIGWVVAGVSVLLGAYWLGLYESLL